MQPASLQAGLKRPGSSGCLAHQQPLPKRACLVTAASSEQQPSAMHVDSATAAAASPMPDVDVAAVAAKHGWDISQQGGAERWAGDRQVRWLRVDEITRPLAGSRSNGAREAGRRSPRRRLVAVLLGWG